MLYPRLLPHWPPPAIYQSPLVAFVGHLFIAPRQCFRLQVLADAAAIINNITAERGTKVKWP